MIRPGKLRIRIKYRVNIMVAKYLKRFFVLYRRVVRCAGIIDSYIAFQKELIILLLC